VGRLYQDIDDELAAWLVAQPVFFVATAPLGADGHINVSPKGVDRLHVLDSKTVAYVDRTGSGVETIAHLRENGRIVLMCCAFEGRPRIVRLHGQGEVIERDDPSFRRVAAAFGRPTPMGTRALILVRVHRIADSCGYGVPLMQYLGDRETMNRWAEAKGVDGIARYQAENNVTSVDGLVGLSGANAKGLGGR